MTPCKTQPARALSVTFRGLLAVAAAAALLLAGASLAHAQSLQVDVANGNSPFTVNAATHYNQVIVGLGTTGVLNHTAGMFRDDNNVTLGNSAGSSGSYNLSGTGALTARNGIIGQFGSGTFTQSGGTNTLSLDLHLGSQTGSSGSYNLSGTGALSASEEFIGLYGNGTFTQSGGTNTVRSELYLGYRVGISGSYTLSGTGELSAPVENIGYNGNGTFTQSGGAHTVGGNLYLGRNAGSSGSYTLSGGTLTTGRTQVSDDANTSSFTQSGGTHSTSLLSLTGFNPSSHGTYRLNGGTLIANSVNSGDGNVRGTSTFNFNGGTLRARVVSTILIFQDLTTANVQAGGAKIDTYGFDITVAQSLLHDTTAGAPAIDGGLTKSGAGTLTLTGANTYTGPTTISGNVIDAAVNGALGSGASVGTSSINVSNGTLTLSNASATDRVRNNAPITLGSGGNVTGSITRSGGGSEGSGIAVGLGALTLGSNSSINYGGASATNGTLTFGGGNLATPFSPAGFILSVLNYNGVFGTGSAGVDGTNDRLIFSASQTANLSKFSFINPNGLTGTFMAGQIDLANGFFEIVPVSASPAVAPTAVVSRKVHNSVPYDIDLPLAGDIGIECRTGGATNAYQVVLSFASPVTYSSAAVMSGAGSVSSSTGTGTNTVTINLTGVTNAQRVTVTLASVSNGSATNNVAVTMGVLVGDTNGSGGVSATDIGQTRAASGQPVGAANFRLDVNVSGGSINASDIGLVKAGSGSSLP